MNILEKNQKNLGFHNNVLDTTLKYDLEGILDMLKHITIKNL